MRSPQGRLCHYREGVAHVEPSEILSQTRKFIAEHAGADQDRWWYCNRFVFARLMLDERKTKTGVRKVGKRGQEPLIRVAWQEAMVQQVCKGTTKRFLTPFLSVIP